MTSEPRYALSGIPNNAAGRRIIAAIKRHTNGPRFHVRVRANGPRADAARADGLHTARYQQNLPQRHAETFRVYFNDSEEPKQRRANWDRIYTAESRTESALRELRATRAELDTITAVSIEYERDARVAREMENQEHAHQERAYNSAPRLVRWIVRTFAPAMLPASQRPRG